MSETPRAETTLVMPPAPAVDLAAPTERLDPLSGEVRIDADHDVLAQVRSSATGMGRPGLEDLSFDLDDLHYEVSNHIKTRVHQPVKKMRRVLPSFSRQTGGAHTIVQKPVETEVVTLKGFNDRGELVSQNDYEASDFGRLLNDHTSNDETGPGYIRGLHFKEHETVNQDSREVPVDLAPGQTVFDSVLETQRKEGLPDSWIGLSWSRKDKDGNLELDFRVVEDNSRSWTVKDQVDPRKVRSRTLREWAIQTSDAAGRITGRSTVNGEQLRKQLEVINTPPNKLEDLRFVVPKSQAEIDNDNNLRDSALYGWFGYLLTGFPEGHKTPVGEELSVNEAAEMLSYRDIYGKDDENQATRIENIKNSVEERKRIKGLQAIVKQYGSDELKDTAKTILNSYAKSLVKLGIRPHHEELSTSWVLAELGERRYLSDRPSEKNEAQEEGLELNNPMGGGAAARMTRQNIIDIRLGQIYADSVIRRSKSPTQVLQEIPIDEREPGGSEFKEVLKSKITIRLDNSTTAYLQPFIRDEVVSILQKAENKSTPEGQPLTIGDFARAGELLRLSLGTS